MRSFETRKRTSLAFQAVIALTVSSLSRDGQDVSPESLGARMASIFYIPTREGGASRPFSFPET